MRKMAAVVKAGPRAGVELHEVPVPEIGPGEVLVKVKVASICGTDLHIYNWDPWAQGRIVPPLIPGHEFCGHVAAVGPEVTSVKEGDFVSAEMHVACGKCLQCRTGQGHICQSVKIIGIDRDGAFADYVVIPETNIWKLDDSIPHEYASILDPLGNAVHTALSGDLAAKNVAITGCGPIGLFAIAVARACGAAQVFAIEVNEYRRNIARQMKADFVLDPATEDVRKIVHERTGGYGVDVLLEMAGHRVLTAHCGRDGVELAREHRPEIIIVDIGLPDIDGQTLYQELKKLHSPLTSHVLFVTGDLMNASTLRFLETCGCPWIAKPFEVTVVRDTVRRILSS